MNIQKTIFSLIFASICVAPAFSLTAKDAAPDVRTIVQILSSSANKTALSMQLLLSNKEIGEALYSYSKNSATLSSLFIKETFRHQGYGAKLFRLVCSMLKKKGCSELTFNVCAFESARNDQPYDLSALVSFFENVGAHVVRYEDYVHGMPTTAVMAIDL